MFGEYVDVAHSDIGIGDDGLEDPHEPFGDPFRGAALEQVGGEREAGAEARRFTRLVGLLGDRQREVVLGALRHVLDHAHGQPGQFERIHPVVLERQHHLEQRRVRRRAPDPQCLHDLLERHVGIAERGQVAFADPFDEIGERIPRPHMGAQDQGVDEHAHQVIERLIAACGERGADGDVVAVAQPRQQRRQRRVRHHEERGTAFLADRFEAAPQLGGDREVDRIAPHRLPGRACVVQRKIDQLGCPGEGVGPVRDLLARERLGVGGVAEDLALPQREVGILHRQRLPQRSGTGGARAVRDHDVTRERRHRCPVGADVVHDEDEQELALARCEQPDTQRGRDRDVESLGGEFGEGRVEFGLDHRDGRQVEGNLLGVDDLLVRAVAGVGEHGPQRLVPREHIRHGRRHRVDVERTGQAHGERDVVRRGRRVEPVHQPHALLSHRQRNPLRARPRDEDRPVGARAGLLGHLDREPFHGRRLEQLAHTQTGARGSVEPGDRLRRHERVAAEVEERLGDTDLREPEHVGQHTGDQFLGGRARLDHLALQGVEVGLGQSPPVEFACGGERDLVEDDDRARHHVRRKCVADEMRHLGHVHRGARGRQHIRHEGGRTRRHRRAEGGRELEVRVLDQRRVDLAEFDPETTDLHLEVAAAHVLHAVTGAVPVVDDEPDDVARAVHPAAVVAERVRDESFGSEAESVVVTASETGARNVQLPCHADGYRAQQFVENVDGDTADGTADLDPAPGHQQVADVAHDGGLGGPVAVVHPTTRCPAFHQFRRARLAADHDDLEPVESGRLHRRERGGRDEGVRDLVVREEVSEFLTAVQIGGSNDHRGTAAEGEQQFEDGRVEARGREVQGPCRRAHPVVGALLGGEVGQPGVSDDDTLGQTGGTGRVDHVRRVVELHRRGPLGIRQRLRRLRGAQRVALGRVQGEPFDARGKGVPLSGHGQAEDRAGVGDHVCDALGRVAGVDGHEGAAGLGHCPRSDHRVQRARHPERHRCFRSHTAIDENPGEPVRARVEFRVGERFAVRDESGALTVLRRGRRQDLRQRQRCDGIGAVRRQQGRTLAGSEDVDVRDERVDVPGQRTEHPDDARHDLLDLGGLEDLGKELGGQVQPRVGHRDDRQRVVRGVVGRHIENAETLDVTALRERLTVERVGLVDHQRVEQRAEAESLLDVGEPDVVVIEQLGLLVLDTVEQGADGVAGPDADTHRQGVDEEPEHGLDAGHLRRTSRDGGAEHHVVPPGQPAQHDSPRGLHESVHGDAEFARACGHVGEQFVRQIDDELTGGERRGGLRVRGCEEGGLLDTVQGLRPCGHGHLRILRGQPLQVAAVRTRLRQRQRVAVHRVQGQQILDEDRQRPAVEEDVVVGDREPVAVLSRLDQQETHQRRCGHVEPVGPVHEHQRLEFRCPLGLGRGRKVDVGPRHVHPVDDHLHAGAVVARHERGAQVGVPCDERLRGAAETVGVDGSAQVHDELGGVHVGGGTGQRRVEQQAHLQRGQRPDVGERGVVTLEGVDPALTQGNEVEVRRRPATGSGPPRVLDEAFERARPQAGELADLGVGENTLGKVDGGRKSLFSFDIHDHRVDVEGEVHRHLAVAGTGQLHRVGVRHPARRPERVGDLAHRHPTEVVETDLRARQRRENRAGLGVEESQHSVADAVLGYPCELFLHRFDGLTCGRTAGEGVAHVDAGCRQPDREHAREPADRAGEIGAGQHRLLAAVTFEVHEGRGLGHAAFRAPCRDGQGEGGEETVVDTAVERARHVGQQTVGDVGRDLEADPAGGRDRIAAVEGPRTDQWVRTVEGGAPVVEFGHAAGAPGVVGEAVRPAADRGADRREQRVGPGGDLRPRGCEVGHQHSPGHPVHGEMVDHDEQSSRLRGALALPAVAVLAVPRCEISGVLGGREPDETHHAAGRRVQCVHRALEGVGGKRLERVGAGSLAELDAIDEPVDVDGADRRDLQRPSGRRVGAAQRRTQSVVAIDDGRQRAHQAVAVHLRRQGQEDGLREAVEVAAQLRHPVHDRCQRHRADTGARQFLEDVHRRRFGCRLRDLGERGHGLALEDVAGREQDTGFLRAGHQLDRDDAVAAEREERVADTDPWQTENLGEQSCDRLLHGAARGHVLTGLRRERGFGQGLPVELAARADRHLGDHHDGVGNHVRGHRTADVDRQILDVQRRIGFGDDVTDEPLPQGAVVDHRDRLRHMGIRGHRGLDLAQFDAQAAHLHLEVGATEVLDAAVDAPLDEVAGAVQTGSRGAEGIGHEAFCRELRPALVAARDLGSREIELSRGSDGSGPEVAVEHVRLGVPHGGADRNRVEGLPLHLSRGGVHRELGGAVEIVQPGLGLRAERCGDGRRKRLSRNENDTQADELFAVGLGDEHRQHRRDERRRRDLLARDHVGEVGGIAMPLGRGDHQARPGGECGEQFPHRHVERRRGLLQHDIVRIERVARRDPRDLVQDRRVAHRHTLRTSGGPGRVDDVGRVGRTQIGEPFVVADRARRDAAQIQGVDLHDVLIGREGEVVPRDREDAQRAGALEHVRRALGGVVGVEGHVRAARRDDGVHRDHGVERAADRERDLRLRTHSPADQRPGETVHPRVELGVRELLAVEDECRRVGRARDLGVEQVDDGPRRRRHDITVPPGHDLSAFLVAHRGQVRHRSIVTGAEEALEEVEEAAVVTVQLVRRVQVGVGLEVDVDLAARHTLVDVQREIFDRSGSEDVLMSGDRPQLDLAVEHHDVDRGTEEATLPLGRSGVPADVLVPVPLAAQGAGELDLDALDQLGDGHLRGDLESERNDVRHHSAGAAQRGGGARRDREAEDDVRAVGHVGQVRGECGHHDRRGAGVAAAESLVEKDGGGLGQRLGGEPRELAHHGRTTGEARGLGQVRGAFGPVFAILREPLGVAVPLLVLDDPDQVLRAAGRRLGALDQGGVDLGDACDQRHRAEAVERDVMDAAEPEVVILPDVEQVDHDEAVLEEVDGGAVVGPHPLLRGVDGIVLGAEVDIGDGVVEGLVDVLVGHPLDLDEAEEAGTELPAGTDRGLGQQIEVDVTAKLDVLGDGERNVAHRVLREPDASLRS
nr:hypothetical protein GCM10017611_84540 [Rhodococcus wratislaviensis]